MFFWENWVVASGDVYEVGEVFDTNIDTVSLTMNVTENDLGTAITFPSFELYTSCTFENCLDTFFIVKGFGVCSTFGCHSKLSLLRGNDKYSCRRWLHEKLGHHIWRNGKLYWKDRFIRIENVVSKKQNLTWQVKKNQAPSNPCPQNMWKTCICGMMYSTCKCFLSRNLAWEMICIFRVLLWTIMTIIDSYVTAIRGQNWRITLYLLSPWR